MSKPGNTGIKRIVMASRYSMLGLLAAYKNEAAFRQECLLFIIMSPLGFYLGESGVERAILIGSLFLVLVVELLNSSVEAIVDRVGEDFHELSGRAKDIGSAAVFVSLINVVVIWAVILWEKL